MFQKKIQYRVIGAGLDNWVHFCYVSDELKKEFDSRVNTLNHSANYWILKWALEDFGVESVDTLDELDDLKSRIKYSYKLKYPELYIESATDQQGWLRVWFTNHMEMELENVGE